MVESKSLARLAATLAVALSLSLPLSVTPAAADADADAGARGELDEARRLALEAAGRMLRALDIFLGDLPQYAAPEVLPNGDILLRRLNPPKEEEPGDKAEDSAEAFSAPPGVPPVSRSPDREGERRI